MVLIALRLGVSKKSGSAVLSATQGDKSPLLTANEHRCTFQQGGFSPLLHCIETQPPLNFGHTLCGCVTER
jgi:hypothetical protein